MPGHLISVADGNENRLARIASRMNTGVYFHIGFIRTTAAGR
jgi:hypothetical protein